MVVKILVAAIAAAIVVGTVSGFVGSTSVAASSARDHAADLLAQVGSDTRGIDSALQEPSIQELTSNDAHPDFKSAQKRFDDFVGLIDQTRRAAGADAARLRSADERLRGYQSNLLALPVRSSLGPGEARVAAMRSALAEAEMAMAVERDQSRTLSALMDALADLSTMGDRFTANDIVGGVAMISGVDAKLQSAGQLAMANDNPIQVSLLISNLRTSLQHAQGVFEAAERNDAGALRSLVSQLEADSQQFDQLRQQLAFYENQVYGFHVDIYHADLEAAGFASPPGTSV